MLLFNKKVVYLFVFEEKILYICTRKMKSLEEAILEVKAYAELNGIEDVETLIAKCLTDGLNILKYGTSPKDNFRREHGIQPKEPEEDVQKEEKAVQEKKKRIVRTIKEKR